MLGKGYLPLNGATHESYHTAVLRLVRQGHAPLASEFLATGDARAGFVDAASLPDRVAEVAVAVPGEGLRTEIAGHGFSSFQHFQLPTDIGYRWSSDDSLTLSTVTALASQIAHMRVVESRGGLRPPLADNTESSPIERAIAAQPSFAVGVFRFPSAAESASFYADAAKNWARAGNAAGFARCGGYALHFVQDACVPHHAWGVLFHGHCAWEDCLQVFWRETYEEVVQANLFATTIRLAVERELVDLGRLATVGSLVAANAQWARHHFGAPADLPECPRDEALRVSIRALATSVRALTIMSEA